MLKNWLKQHKAAPALDFPYFQSVSILAVQDRKVPGMDHSGYFLLLFVGYKFGLSNTFLTHRPVKWSAAVAICYLDGKETVASKSERPPRPRPPKVPAPVADKGGSPGQEPS